MNCIIFMGVYRIVYIWSYDFEYHTIRVKLQDVFFHVSSCFFLAGGWINAWLWITKAGYAETVWVHQFGTRTRSEGGEPEADATSCLENAQVYKTKKSQAIWKTLITSNDVAVISSFFFTKTKILLTSNDGKSKPPRPWSSSKPRRGVAAGCSCPIVSRFGTSRWQQKDSSLARGKLSWKMLIYFVVVFFVGSSGSQFGWNFWLFTGPSTARPLDGKLDAHPGSHRGAIQPRQYANQSLGDK